MKKISIGTIILCLLHSILLVNQNLGINVILFTIPLLGFLVYMMWINKVIKNKWGLLFIIPILVLSTTYFIYDNTWKYLNILGIPTLYFLMYIFTIKPMNTFEDTIVEFLNLLVKPINYIGKFVSEESKIVPKRSKGKEKKGLNEQEKLVLKSILIVAPVVIVVLMLLSSADSIFGGIFKTIFNFDIGWFNYDEIIPRIIVFVLLFFYLGSTIYFITKEYLKEKRVKGKSKEYPALTLNMLLICLDIIYVIFDIIQINSLMLHRVATNFNYAEYARSGFFQLMVISFINITIILLSKKCKEETKTKGLSILMVLLTYIIIGSSFYRMYLYEAAYGYTVLRLGVYAILITEGILLVPTIVYIINKKMNILNYYLVIMIGIYTLINCFSVDRIIAKNNIDRYKRTGQIDIWYLQNTNYDNLNQLRELYTLIQEDEKIEQIDKDNFRIYIGHMDKRNEMNLLEWNLSKEEAKIKRGD